MRTFWLVVDVLGFIAAAGYAIAYAGWGLSFWDEPKPGAGLLFVAFATTAWWWTEQIKQDA